MENLSSIRPIVIGLLRQACRFHEKCDHSKATIFYRAAIAADETPLAKIEYATFISREDEPRAEELLLECWEAAKHQSNPTLAAQACHNLACLYRDRANDALARQFQQLAISAELQALERGHAETVSHECRLGLMLDDQLSGDAFAEGFLDQQMNDSVDLDVLLTLHLNLAMLNFQRGELQTSLLHARAAVGAALSLQQPEQLLESLQLLGRLLINDGSWHEACVCLKHAADWASLLDRKELANTVRQDINRIRSQMESFVADPARN